MPEIDATLLDSVQNGLSAFGDELECAIHRLETALTEGNLSEALIELSATGRLTPQLRQAYDPLLRITTEEVRAAAALRATTVRTLLEAARSSLANPRYRFDAEAVMAEASGAETDSTCLKLKGVVAHGPNGSCELRTKVLVALRYWSIGFDLADSAAATFLSRAIASSVSIRLASGLGSILKIANWLANKQQQLEREAIVSIGGLGQDFEQLVLDVLNESDDVAIRATLFEDFAEKTDLRVKLADPPRRHGARAQVTLQAESKLLARKLGAMRYGGREMIVISPFTLAEALLQAQIISSTERNALLTNLGTQRDNVHAVAKAVKQLFTSAIAAPRIEPQGPLANLPKEMREFVRQYVAQQAIEKTSEMRRREQAERCPTRCL